jgi:asparagine synthase (glutamine-hydrolysing)
MCGIVGQARADRAPVDVAVLERMCGALEHRGPDSRGLHRDEGVGLGIQRLRVIDLATGDQPIYNEDRTVAVVLNGEIYNYRELRRLLESAGHRFSSQSDTEVIVHLYEEEGPACVRHLHGMFAFAVWDRRRARLVLARDRVGKKPLFYCHRDGVLSFASELGALMQDKEIPREVDHQALDCYLTYLCVPAPMSAFKAVRKLAPATTLVYDNGRVRTERYWRLDYSRKRSVADAGAVQEELRERIRAAVRRRMIADVPLGAFLSGGIDSSAVVAAMAEASPQPVKTFSIGFEQDRFNELAAARLIAERYSTDHEEFMVRPDAIEIVPTLLRRYGEPFADSSAIPSFYLAELTRRHVTVALNGDGGDESFAGYNRYLSNLVATRLERLPLGLRRAVSTVAGRLPARSDDMASALSRLRRLTGTLALDSPARYAEYHSAFGSQERDQLYTPEYRRLIGRSVASDVIRRPWEEASGRSPIDVMLEVDVNTYLPNDLLVKMDIATMAHSLEARSPFLDHELMEFAASLPPALKVRRGKKKALLRDALRGWLPDSILDAPKRGFSVPMADWLRGELKGYATETLLDRTAVGRGYFREAYVRALLDDHAARRADNSFRIWTLLIFELWHREFVDRV